MLDSQFFAPLIEKAIELLAPQKIYLFGSFARGDELEKSDIDLAFEFDSPNWSQFTTWVNEEFQTLRQLDLIDMKSASSDILESINKEGVILYERKD